MNRKKEINLVKNENENFKNHEFACAINNDQFIQNDNDERTIRHAEELADMYLKTKKLRVSIMKMC